MNNAKTQEAFQFLVESHGYSATSDSFQSPYLVVSPSYSERDGFDTSLKFPQYSPSPISVGTILSAIDRDQTRDVGAQVTFLRTNLHKLERVPPSIHEDLVSLRFWHAPKWRKDWGNTIRLPPDALEPEMARLVRLREFFGSEG